MFGASSNSGSMFGGSQQGASSGFTFGGQNKGTGNGNAFGANNNNNTANAMQSGGAFGCMNNSAGATPSTGIFGNSSAPAQPAGGIFGNNASTPSQSPSAGLFGNKRTTTSGGMFGNGPANAAPLSSTGASSGLFGNSANSKPLFGGASNTTGTPSSALFGNSSTQQQGGLSNSSVNSSNNMNPLLNGTPMKQYNFKDLPKSLTDSTKTNKKIYLTDSSRKRSLSTTTQAPVSQGKSSLFQSFGSRFSTLQTQASYNSEGLFSPKKDLIQSVLKSENPTETNVSLNKVAPHRRFAANGLSSRSVRAPRSVATDYLKLKIDPARTEARKMKIFGESGGAKKVRILGREESEEVPTINSNEDGVALTPSQPSAEKTRTSKEIQINLDVEQTDYWCSPSIEELQKLPLRQLAEVPGFTIGRKGYGVIRFDLPVDLTTFWSDLQLELFDNTVKINKNHTVEVYPLGSVPLGTGLNVPATITLEKVFPVTRGKIASNSATKDLEFRLFVKKLRELKDMEFVTYDPINGSWTFKVKHFSIWGLVDEDDAVVDIEEELSKLKQKSPTPQQSQQMKQSNPLPQQEHNMKIAPPRIVKTDSMAEDTFIYRKQKQDQTFEFDTTSLIPGSFMQPDLYQYVQQELDDVPNTENILSDFTTQDSAVPSQLPTQHIGEDDEFFDGEDFDMVEKQYEPEVANDEDFDILDANPLLDVSDDWDRQLELSGRFDSVFANKSMKQTTVFDAPFSKSLTPGELDKLLYGDFSEVIKSNNAIKRELRLDGTYNFTNFTPTNRVLRRSSKTASHVCTESLAPLYGSDETEFYTRVYKAHSATSKIVARANGFPRVTPNKDINFKLIIDGLGYDFSERESTIWELASALFDNTINDDLKNVNDSDVINRVLEIQRREGLIAWIKPEIQSEIDSKLGACDDVFEQIFLLLSSFNINSAAKLAIKTNNLHLSALISLLGSNDPDVKYSAGKQLDSWRMNAVLHTIPNGLVKIYYLLKGDVLTTDPIAPITEGVSWKTKLGLLLSYGDLNESLATLLGSFVDSEKSDIPEKDLTHFSLLKLFVFKHNSTYDVCDIFANLSGSSILDIRLQWYIYEILVRSTRQVSIGDSEIGDRLTLLFSEQLQANQLWEEALFVLSHLHSDVATESTITKLLTTYIELLADESLCTRLTNDLHIPSTLISECKALYFRYSGDHWNEASCLLEAGKFCEAHRSIVTFVAPEAVINNGSKLVKLQRLIGQFPEHCKIADWCQGLGVYKNYLKLVSSKDAIIARAPLRSLIEILPIIKPTNFKMRVSVKLMASFAAKKLTQLQSEEGTGVMNLDVAKTAKLPLGESERSMIVMLDRFFKKEALSY